MKRIQLSRPSSTACCITEGGRTQAHTARKHVGSSAQKKWTLRRTLVEVCRGADSPKPPQDRGAHFRSHATDAACPHREHVIQYVASDEGLWGTSVKEHHATIWREGVSSTVNPIFMVKEALSRVMMSPTRQGPCFGIAKERSTPGVTAKASGLLFTGASEKQVEYSGGGPGQARARVPGRSGAGENHEFRRSRSGCRIAERRLGLPTRP